jgi:hypothetical protein
MRLAKIQIERRKKFRNASISNALGTFHRLLVPVQSKFSVCLVAGNIVGCDTSLKVVRALIPGLRKQLRGSFVVSLALFLHTLDAQLHDGIVRVHGSTYRGFDVKSHP